MFSPRCLHFQCCLNAASVPLGVMPTSQPGCGDGRSLLLQVALQLILCCTSCYLLSPLLQEQSCGVECVHQSLRANALISKGVDAQGPNLPLSFDCCCSKLHERKIAYGLGQQCLLQGRNHWMCPTGRESENLRSWRDVHWAAVPTSFMQYLGNAMTSI